MISKEFTIVNKLGLHARAAAKLVAIASTFESKILIEKDNRNVNGKSIMGVMMLAASQHSKVTVTASGTDEEEAMASIENLVNNFFDEDG